MKINWVTIRVKNMQESLDFYHGTLNMEITAKLGTPEHQIVMLGNPDETKIELICEGNHADPIENPGAGVSIGLAFPNLDEIVNTLKNMGKNVVGPISPMPNVRFFFVKDPNGYTIQLLA